MGLPLVFASMQLITQHAECFPAFLANLSDFSSWRKQRSLCCISTEFRLSKAFKNVLKANISLNKEYWNV